ncbi:glycosyltransferase family 2 protein [Noviherbaspirillum malthae]|uniref:glycosyltransferase family 2 protein n=1 Tax=Noviherbaspirillum malthae TaxID=1260987 RepID=UPI00188DC80E|nr:glycosyltransferase family 2 protein [Noviherbaspirillum malthae]
MSQKVAAIVVTYNRKQMLLQCLEGLLNQSFPIDQIIVVDNASTDGTEQLLEENNYLSHARIRYQRLPQNTGGAGGFHAGLAQGLLTHADWFWLTDDDVCPQPDCLSELIRYRGVSECLHPRIVLLNNDYFKWEQTFDLTTLGRTHTDDISFQNEKEIAFTNVGCFEGMLVSRRIVEKIGLPNAEYFISDDDTLFGLKASAHTNVAYVKAAKMNKLLSIAPVSPWKSYFIVRNKFYLRTDGLNYFRVRSTYKQDTLFILSQLTDVIRYSRMGRNYVGPAVRGFIHGIRYHALHKSV